MEQENYSIIHDHNMSIIGREQEYEELQLSIKQFCILEHFGCLMIHGEPGVGKTSLINKLLKDEEFLEENNIDYTVEINLIKLSTQIIITKSISNQLDISARSFKDISNWINSLRKNSKVLMIFDEIDMLYSKNLSQMTMWICQCLNSMDFCKNCIVIGMSNETQGTYELRRAFESSPYFNHLRYSHLPIEDIISIIKKLDYNSLFDKEETNFLVDKVIKKEGDIREIYSLMEKSYKYAQQKGLSKIKTIHLIEIYKSNSPEEMFKSYLASLNDEQLSLVIALHISPEISGRVVIDKWFEIFQKCRNVILQRKINVRKNDFFTAIEHFISQGLIQVVLPSKRGKMKVNYSANYINGNIKCVVKRYNSSAMDQFLRSNKHAISIFDKISDVLTPNSISGMLQSKRNVVSYI